MKASEFTPCLVCRKPVGDKGGLLFYQITIERMVFDPDAVRTNLGLGMMVRSTALMEVLSPTPEIAQTLGEPEKILLCDECAMQPVRIAALEECAADRRNADAGDDEPTAAAPNDPPTGEAA